MQRLHRSVLRSSIMPVKMRKPKRNNSWMSMMLFITVPLGTLQSFKFNVWCYSTPKSMLGDLWRKLKWGFLQVEFVGKKYCKISFSPHSKQIEMLNHYSFSFTKKKKKRSREPLWYSGQYVNIERTCGGEMSIKACGKIGEVKPGYFRVNRSVPADFSMARI